MSDTIGAAVIVGPTASGKTALAAALAGGMGGEVVSADSMQIYRGMDIGTAKPTGEQMRGVPHHMIDIAEPYESFSVARYTELAGKCIKDIHARGKLVIISGGTGLYIDSLISETRFGEIPFLPGCRQELERLAGERGADFLHGALAESDPESAARIHPNDVKRVIRALEVLRATGVPISEWRRRSKCHASPYRPVYIGLCFKERAEIYRRIDKRVDDMIGAGLVNEVGSLLKIPGAKQGTAMQAIGYKEIAQYLRGECSLDESIDRVKRETRRYAKRQMTWLRRNKDINWICADDNDFEQIYNYSKNMLENSGVLW